MRFLSLKREHGVETGGEREREREFYAEERGEGVGEF